MTALLLAALLGAPPPAQDDVFRALGATLEERVKALGLSEAEYEIVKRGLEDGMRGAKPAVDMETYGPKVRLLSAMRQQAAVDKLKAASKEVVEKAAQEPGAVRLPSGAVYRQLSAGTGASPTADSTVKVAYEGRLSDGRMFDSSKDLEFPLSAVIKCWKEGVQKMKVGEKARLTCPSDAAYGDRGHPPNIPGGATLIFDVELLAISGK